ncbi:MAG: hypothetical protein R3A48_17555 [Polyangiales bacterium]
MAQVFPQVPQFVRELRRSAQTPLHEVWGVRQPSKETQAPATAG